jgi:hypothetical protein
VHAYACIANAPGIVTFVEVEMFEVSGEWGARPCRDTKAFITTAVDQEWFFRTLVHH